MKEAFNIHCLFIYSSMNWMTSLCLNGFISKTASGSSHKCFWSSMRIESSSVNINLQKSRGSRGSLNRFCLKSMRAYLCNRQFDILTLVFLFLLIHNQTSHSMAEILLWNHKSKMWTVWENVSVSSRSQKDAECSKRCLWHGRARNITIQQEAS